MQDASIKINKIEQNKVCRKKISFIRLLSLSVYMLNKTGVLKTK